MLNPRNPDAGNGQQGWGMDQRNSGMGQNWISANSKVLKLLFSLSSDRRIHGTPVAVWILDSARELGIRGGTLVAASEGLDHQGKLHWAHFFEPADQPQEVTLAVTQQELDKLFELLSQQEGRIFYVKTPVEFGSVGKGSDAEPAGSHS